MERNQFTFYRSYLDAAKKMPKRDRDMFLLAICEYALDGKEIKLSENGEAFFALVRPNLDAARKKAEKARKKECPDWLD